MPCPFPDGTAVAYVTDRTGLPRLEVAPVEVALCPGAGSSPGPVTVSAPDQEVISVAWSPDGRWLAYLVSPGGLLRAELHVCHPDGADRRLLAGAGELETVFAGTWTNDGRYAFSLADGRSAGTTVHLADPVGGGLTLVGACSGLGFTTVTSVAPDGASMIVRSGPRNRRRLFVVDLRTGTAPRPLLPGHPPELHQPGAAPPAGWEAAEDGRFAADGQVYLRGWAGGQRLALVRVPIGPGGPGRPETVVARPGADLEGFAVLAGARSALLVWNDAGTSRAELVDLGSGAATPVPLPDRVMPGWSLHADGRFLVAEVTGPAAPRSLHLVHLPRPDPDRSDPDFEAADPVADRPVGPAAGRLAQLPDPNLPAGVVTPELRQFHAADGTPLTGWLYRPAGLTGPGPGVVNLHGGPESQERPAFAQLSQAMVAAGITVFAPNVRGSSGHGRSFMAADDVADRPASFGDVAAAAEYLVAEGLADGDALGVHGWSYGGYLAMTALVRWPELFRAGATHAGMSDLQLFFAETETWMAAASVTEYGDPETQADLLRALSPIHQFARLQAPLLLIHGDRDTNVPVAESVRAHRVLQALGKQSRLVILPGEGHTVVGADHRIELVSTVVEWFDQRLRTGADVDSGAGAGAGHRVEQAGSTR